MTLSDTVNLARRLTSRAENADVQEDYHILSIDDCQAMAIALKGKLNKLPSECSQYVGTAYQKAQAKETITETSAGDANIAFEGMGAAAASVKAERNKGRVTQAVMQRRYTSRSNKPPNK
eukprot:CAMPEP_0171322942 /NCGR_PEP_ID=MMETSP0816-20121228/115267_1 /TAXON_ID=420281 /ORGANISM="Proboscia inermis, Strain CCAP1064/1" /LENGTH=119 /DNA_ID=CAMNT_0011821531 /DNA_START=522 /DNA_END=881 /DNA_ORIENTATION=-